MKILRFFIIYIFLTYARSQCVKTNCFDKNQTISDKCLKQASGTINEGGFVYVVQDMCNQTIGEYCDPKIDKQEENFFGECKLNQTFTDTTHIQVLYPGTLQFQNYDNIGEQCLNETFNQECLYGQSKCYDQQCIGFEIDSCDDSLDCNMHLYCDKHSYTCKKTKQMNEKCQFSEQCDFGMKCYYNSSSIFLGECKLLFSLDENQPLLIKEPEDIYFCKSGFAISEKNQFKNIQLKTVKKGMHYCAPSLLSYKAGQRCDDNQQCPTNYDNIFASCGCTYSSQIKRCDILNSNYEYREFIQAVIQIWFSQAKEYYYSQFQSCHTARFFEGETCQQDQQLFRDMMCKKMQAIHYLPNHNIQQCVLDSSNQYLFPQLQETRQWCSLREESSLAMFQYGDQMQSLIDRMFIMTVLINYFI